MAERILVDTFFCWANPRFGEVYWIGRNIHVCAAEDSVKEQRLAPDLGVSEQMILP